MSREYSLPSLDEARLYAGKLLADMEQFATPDLVLGHLQCEGKRATVEALLRSVQGLAGACYSDHVFQADSSTSTALPVTSKRVAMPEEAGLVDPLAWLPPDQAEVAANLDELWRELRLWEDICKACHRVPQEEEAELAEKLLSTGVAVRVAEDDLPRDQAGQLMQGDLFAVSKNEDEDRLIFDRRPPSAACFTRTLLEPNQCLRGSGDDLRNFYYTFDFRLGGFASIQLGAAWPNMWWLSMEWR